MNHEEQYQRETHKDPFSHCKECGRHSAYSTEFVEWLVNQEHARCVRRCRELYDLLLAYGHDYAGMKQFANEEEKRDPFVL